MLRQILIFISAIGFWMPAVAQDKVSALPKNTVDCKQFRKTGPKEWIEVGTAVFDLGAIKDINLTDQPVTPGYFKFGGIDLYPVLEGKCSVPASPAPAPQPALMAAGPILKEEADPSRDAATAGQLPAQPGKDQGVPTSVSRKADLESERESGSCPSKKLVYAANGPGGIESERRSSSLSLKANIKRTWRLRSILNSKSVNTETICSGGHTKESFCKKRLQAALASPCLSLEGEDTRCSSLITSNRTGMGQASLFSTWLGCINYLPPRRMDAPPRLKASAHPTSCLKYFTSIAASDGKPLLDCPVVRFFGHFGQGGRQCTCFRRVSAEGFG